MLSDVLDLSPLPRSVPISASPRPEGAILEEDAQVLSTVALPFALGDLCSGPFLLSAQRGRFPENRSSPRECYGGNLYR